MPELRGPKLQVTPQFQIQEVRLDGERFFEVSNGHQIWHMTRDDTGKHNIVKDPEGNLIGRGKTFHDVVSLLQSHIAAPE